MGVWDKASLPLIYLLCVHFWLISVKKEPEICKWLRFPWDTLWSGFEGNVSGLKWSMRSGRDDRWFHLYSQQGCQRSLVTHPPCAPGRSGVSFHYPWLKPCLWVPGPSLFPGRGFSDHDVRSTILDPLVSHLPLCSLPQRSSLFTGMDSFKWQLSSCCHDFPINVVRCPQGAFSSEAVLSWGTHTPMRTFNSTVNSCVDNTLKAHSIGVPLRIW